MGLVLEDNIERKPLVYDLYTANPSAKMFNGKIYIYPSHDQNQEMEEKDNGDQYDMIDYHTFEMSDTEHYPKDLGEELNVIHIKWASKQVWAPDCVEKMEDITSYFLHVIKKVCPELVWL